MVGTGSVTFLIVSVTLIILSISVLMKIFKQPHVIAYILAGVLIGPFGLKIVSDIDLVSTLGSVGVMILLFFIGMEVSIQRIISNWKIAIFGTFFQILFSVGFTYFLSMWIDWSFTRILIIGFVISLSSTAVVLKILKDLNEIDTKVGQNVLSILLVQDVAVIFMLISISFLGENGGVNYIEIFKQVIGTIFFVGLIIFAMRKGDSLKLPLPKMIKEDFELQLFLGLILCFGFAFLSDYFHLSSALGAFVAGILLSMAKESNWVENKLSSFYVLFVAIFFLSVGMLLDLNFIMENFKTIGFLVLGVFLTNTFLNAIIIRFLNNSWAESFYAGALLSAIGEFSFILGSVAFEGGILTDYEYSLTISIIALTLLLSPMWIAFFKKILKILEKTNPGKYLQKIIPNKEMIKTQRNYMKKKRKEFREKLTIKTKFN